MQKESIKVFNYGNWWFKMSFFTSFLWRTDSVCRHVVCSFVHAIVRATFTKCTIMYCKQMAGPRSANSCTHIHVGNIPSPANFHPNPQRTWPSISLSKIWIEIIGKCICKKRSVCRHGGDDADGLYQSLRCQGVSQCHGVFLSEIKQVVV